MSGTAFAAVTALLGGHFPTKAGRVALQPATRLREDLGLDSMDLLTLASELENDLGQPLAGEHEAISGEIFETIGSLARHVARIRGETP